MSICEAAEKMRVAFEDPRGIHYMRDVALITGEIDRAIKKGVQQFVFTSEWCLNACAVAEFRQHFIVDVIRRHHSYGTTVWVYKAQMRGG